MNSNFIEFGIINPKTGKMKREIIHCFLHSCYLTIDNLTSGIITSPNEKEEPYFLSMDKRLMTLLARDKRVPALISFQKRTDGNFAVARLFETNRIKIKEGVK